ncbi:MAG: A/G-specific adenine glycosylase [Bacilli bacterium]|nr:A/G-specific adenine glycosylase [Bacilli bacterium]
MEKCIHDILDWYQKNKRDLPWRRGCNPYHVWISEVMLQQTRIETVIDYYHRFLQKLPSIESLATVPEEDLFKLWEGLGYYTRAKNLKKSAQIIINQYHGEFPHEYHELITLPGIGDYTASAISSICFQKKKATIDGNVLRVYTRFYNNDLNISLLKTRKEIGKKIEEIIPNESGDFNQALMEIGEVLCIPNGIPHCNRCPLHSRCLAGKYSNYALFPKRQLKREKKTLEYTIFIFNFENTYAISKRNNEGILHQLWQFPNVEGTLTKTQVEAYLNSKRISYSKIKEFITYTHVFTHQKWKMISYYIELGKPIGNNQMLFLSIDKIIKDYAIPTAFQPFLKKLQI